MNRNWFTSALSYLYGWLLWIYPPDFRSEFGEEMQAVFALAAWETGKHGLASQVLLLLREIRDISMGGIRLRAQGRGRNMEANEKDPLVNSLADPVIPAPWREVAAGMSLFILLGIPALVYEAPLPRTYRLINFDPGFILSLGSSLIILAGILWGWLKGFPRWSFPYLASEIFWAWTLANAATPGLVIFHTHIWGRELWGIRAWAPLGLVALLALLLSRPPWGPLVKLGRAIWNDWTLLVFGLYGSMPILFSVWLDEMQHSYSFPPAVVAMIFILIGAFIYLRFPSRQFQLLGLLLNAFLANLALGIGSEFYWSTHSVNFATGQSTLLSGPVPWGSILLKSAFFSGIVILPLLSPILLKFVKWAVEPNEPGAGGPAA